MEILSTHNFPPLWNLQQFIGNKNFCRFTFLSSTSLELSCFCMDNYCVRQCYYAFILILILHIVGLALSSTTLSLCPLWVPSWKTKTCRQTQFDVTDLQDMNNWSNTFKIKESDQSHRMFKILWKWCIAYLETMFTSQPRHQARHLAKQCKSGPLVDIQNK